MASSLTLDRFVQTFNATLRSHRTAAISTLGIALVLPFAVNDYRVYLSYGPGGLPYNVAGWLVTNVLRLFAREQLSTKAYEDKRLPFSREPGYLPTSFPPQRR